MFDFIVFTFPSETRLLRGKKKDFIPQTGRSGDNGRPPAANAAVVFLDLEDFFFMVFHAHLIRENLTTAIGNWMDGVFFFCIQMEIRPLSNCSDNRVAQPAENPIETFIKLLCL